MTISQEMLAAAARAVRLLGEDRAAEMGEFYRRLLRPDGGFADRAGKSDLYYTVFGLQACSALGVDLPVGSVRSYLQGFGEGRQLDMVHLGCLARCWAVLDGEACPPPVRSAVLRRIEACRSADGGYAQQTRRPAGSAYGCFLALGACQDLGADLPDAGGAARCLAGLAVGDGSYANDASMPVGSAPATAAAVMVLAHLRLPADARSADWLLAQHDPAGGFRAVPIAPEPDMLSTAVALQALRKLGADVSAVRPGCLAFARSLCAEGRFAGHGADTALDGEYTFYGLLALGCLEE
jgi:hypothetical protein